MRERAVQEWRVRKHVQELVDRSRELVGLVLCEWVEGDAETGLPEDLQGRASTPVEHIELNAILPASIGAHSLHNGIAGLSIPSIWRMSDARLSLERIVTRTLWMTS